MAFYNCVKLEYHDFIQYRIYKKPIEKDYEKSIYDGVGVDENTEETINDELSKNERKEHSKKVSLNRTKQTIYSLAYNNKWDWFVTLTLDPDKIDRFDYTEVIKKVTKWLNNFKSRKAPDLKYILIPEPHKSGAYHFHGLFANVPVELFQDSGRVFVNKKAYKRTKNNSNFPWIYNLPSWSMGWSTATKVVSNAKCVSYMTKYVTKELCQIALNKRRYLSSTNLDRVVKEYLNLPINQIDEFIIDSYVNDRVDFEKTQTIAEAGQQIRYITIKK